MTNPLQYLNTDITTVTSGIIGHGCNCSGGFGSGVAGAIRKKWPVMYEKFQENGRGRSLLGSAHIIRIDKNLYIANCYTQEFYGKDGKVYASPDAIRSSVEFCYSFFDNGGGFYDTGLDAQGEFYNYLEDPTEFHFPKIGSGLGGLDWETQVRPIFEELNAKYPYQTTYIHSI